MTPVYFASGNQSLFGWLHQPTSAPSDVGVVLCKPFGYEAICAHSSLRAFADACAAIGVTVLRFDYSGTGDSSGGDTDADQMAEWSGDIVAAIAALRRLSGVRRVCLLGVRLGALLAARAACDEGVDALIAVVPVVDGRRYLRELRAYQAGAGTGKSGALGGTVAVAAVTAPVAMAAVAAPGAGDALEVTGFTLSAASVASLQRTDLKKSALPGVSSALIVDRSDLPGAKPWADALRAAGTGVDYCSLPGFAEMVCTPHATQVPQAMVGATIEWLQRFQLETATSRPACDGRGPSSVVPEAVMRMTHEDGSSLTERALFIDEQRTLFAIITAADTATATNSATRYGVVMLNGGATSHIGPNRMNVEISRRWAARGYVVLRLDLAGLGDSATRPGRSGNEVYPPGAVDDISAAIEYLRRVYGVDNMTLAGLCAGAYHALCSARQGLPVNTVLLVNPLTFYWKQGATMSDLQIAEVMSNPGIYAERVMNATAWLKLLRGRVNLWRVAMIFVRRVWLSLESSVRNLGRYLNIHLRDDLGWDLRSIASRGVQIVFLFARGDAGAALLHIQGASAIHAIGDRCRIHMIDGADHIFSQSAARRQLVQLLSSELPK